MKRVEAVREYRLASKSPGTVKLADSPTRFHVENIPNNTYIVIPEVSSEKRIYVPMGFMTPDILCSNLVRIVSNATLYHFGVLTSIVHMGWMRAVCGRLKSDYRYSVGVVYNTFPWPNPTSAQKARIEQTAAAIIKARDNHLDCTMADLYDNTVMPPDLRKAHRLNDEAVLDAYGLPHDISEPACVAHLLDLYRQLTAT